MNDIDQRCDGYLTWLDARRRDKEPILAELAAMTAAASSIMTATGASVKALNIVTTAFGLAAISYTQWNSRLLISVEQSTVQNVVYNYQGKYRDTIKAFVVADRPTTIYLLRNYLRLCTPIVIEANINTSSTLVSFDTKPPVQSNLVLNAVSAPLTASQPVGQPNRSAGAAVPAYAAVFVNYTPAQYRPSFVVRIQSALCVPSSEQGTIGTFTTNLIAIYLQATRQPITGKLDDSDVARILSPPSPNISCSSDGAKNYYERVTYTDADKISALIKRLNKSSAGGTLADTATLASARGKIQAMRSALSSNLTLQLPVPLADQMTRDLDIALFNLH
jgi:hypothetical protein